MMPLYGGGGVSMGVDSRLGLGMSQYWSSSNDGLSNDLIVRALNYHGQQLTSFVKEQGDVYSQLDLKNVDYHLYHQRSKDLHLEDRGKRLKLHRFIANNIPRLFTENESGSARKMLENEEHSALLPPYETFADIHEDDRSRHFFEVIVPGDGIFCRVIQKSMSGLMLSVLCMDPIIGKSRYIEDLKIRGFCPSAEMIPADDPRDPHRSYESGDIVRLVVLEVKTDSQRLLGSMKIDHLPADLQAIVKLGLVHNNELPSTYVYSIQAVEKKVPYNEFLEKSVGFINPTNVGTLGEELGLDTKASSLLKSLGGVFDDKFGAVSLRKEQASKWAFKHVAQGIKYFKSGNNIEAFQCLNQALNIDAENVEGLVARGALYANNGGLAKAIADFETALKNNPHHKNGKKYLCETLIALARNHEDDNKVDLAIETYERILALVPDHKEAIDSIYYLKGRPKDVPLGEDSAGIPGLFSDKTWQSKEKLKFMLEDEKIEKEEKLGRRESREKKEKERKKKKRRKRGSSSSSDSSSSSSSSNDSDSGSARRKKRKNKKEKRKKSRSVSPFSLRSGTENASAPRPLSPFSQKMYPGYPAQGFPVPIDGVHAPAMNMPPGYFPPTQEAMANCPPPPNQIQHHRLSSGLILGDKVEKSEPTPPGDDGMKSTNFLTEERLASPDKGPSVDRDDKSSVISHPAIPQDFSVPPPGLPPPGYPHVYYPPAGVPPGVYPGYPTFGQPAPPYGGQSSFREREYDDKVRRFLAATAARSPERPPSWGRSRSRNSREERRNSKDDRRNSKEDRRSKDRHRRVSERDRDHERSRHRSDRSKEREKESDKVKEKEKDRGRSKEKDREGGRSKEKKEKKREKSKTKESSKSPKESSGHKKKKKSRRKSNSSSPSMSDNDDLERKLKEYMSKTDEKIKEKEKKVKSAEKEHTSPTRSAKKKKEKDKERRKDTDMDLLSIIKEKVVEKKRKFKENGSGADIFKLKELEVEKSFHKSKSIDEEKTKKPEKKPKKDNRIMSPSARKVFDIFDDSDGEGSTKNNKPNSKDEKKASVPAGIWKPVGEDSMHHTISTAISMLEERDKGIRESRDREKKEATPKIAKSGWSENRIIRMTTEAPPPDPDFKIEYDQQTRMYIRVPKPVEIVKKVEETPKKKTKAELIANKRIMMDQEDSEPEIEVVENRTVRRLEVSPPKSPVKKIRTNSTEDKKRSNEKRSRSRSRSRKREKRSRSRRRSGSRGRRRSGSRGKERKRSRSRDGERKRSRSRDGDRRKERDGQRNRHGSGGIKADNNTILGIRDETDRIKMEREAIEREKYELMAQAREHAAMSKGQSQSQSNKVRDEFSSVDSVMDKVLEAVDGKKGDTNSKKDRRSSHEIKPKDIVKGKETFEDLEAYLKMKKSQKLEEMKKNKARNA